MVGGAEVPHPLLARHQELGLGQRLHGKEAPTPTSPANPGGAGGGGHDPIPADGHREASLNHSPVTLAKASTHDATPVTIVVDPPDEVAMS